MRAATDRAPSTIAWLLVLGVVPALGGCSISSLLAENAAAIRDTRDELKATRGSIAGLSQQLQSVDKSMQSVSGLEQPLHEVATLRTALEDATRLESALHDVAGLRDELHQVGELRESMQKMLVLRESLERVIAMREPLDRLSGMQGTMERLATTGDRVIDLQKMDPPLRAIAGMEPVLAKLDGNLGKLESLSQPLSRTADALQTLLSIVQANVLLIVLLLVVWCGATFVAVWLGMRLALRQAAVPRSQS